MKSLLKSSLVLLLLLEVSWSQSVDSTFGTSDSVDSTFNNGAGLTDQQNRAAQEFVHQGRKDAVLKKACEEAGKACDPNSPDNTKVLLPGVIEQNIGKLYTVLFGGMGLIGGGGPSVNARVRPPEAAPGAAGSGTAANTGTSTTTTTGTTTGQPQTGQNGRQQPREKKADYCFYIAATNEILATAMQTSQQNRAQQESANLNDPQLQALVNLKETHKARKRTATFQGAMFGATAGCYAARMLLDRGISVDTSYIIKMGAAAGISALYLKKADKHGDAMKKIDKVIGSLPKAGDCNPWTGTSCFCKEATSQQLYPSQYQEVCVLNNGIADGPKANLGCGVMVNGQVKFDEQCQCKANNSCITSQLRIANPSIGLGSNFLNSTNAGLALLDPSQFDEGKLRSFGNGMAAMNSRLKTPKVPVGNANLNDEQRRVADSLKDVVPPAVANAAALASPSGNGADNSLMGATSSGLNALPPALKKQVSDPVISGNYRSGGGGNGNAAVEEPGFSMPGLPGQEEASAGGTEVLSFAERAVSNADVSNRPETPIFDIISNRYRASGMRRLSVE